MVCLCGWAVKTCDCVPEYTIRVGVSNAVKERSDQRERSTDVRAMRRRGIDNADRKESG
jgi:hypothetical protein